MFLETLIMFHNKSDQSCNIFISNLRVFNLCQNWFGSALDVIYLSKMMNWQKCTKVFQIIQWPK